MGVSPDVYYIKGLVELYSGSPEKAKQFLTEGMKLDPDNKKCLLALKASKQQEEFKQKGNDLLNAGKYKEAVELYSRALEMDLNNRKLNAILYANRGLAHQKSGDHPKAIEDFDKSIELNENYFKAYLRRGDSKFALSDFDAAAADYQRVMELDRSQSQGLRQKIMDCQRMAKQAARKDYYKILEVPRDASENDIKKAYRRLAL